MHLLLALLSVNELQWRWAFPSQLVWHASWHTHCCELHLALTSGSSALVMFYSSGWSACADVRRFLPVCHQDSLYVAVSLFALMLVIWTGLQANVWIYVLAYVLIIIMHCKTWLSVTCMLVFYHKDPKSFIQKLTIKVKSLEKAGDTSQTKKTYARELYSILTHTSVTWVCSVNPEGGPLLKMTRDILPDLPTTYINVILLKNLIIPHVWRRESWFRFWPHLEQLKEIDLTSWPSACPWC